MNKDTLKTNVESVAGQEAVVTEEIDNLLGTGKALLNGNPWTARSEAAEKKISAGATVEVIRVEGVKLIVREIVREKESKEAEEVNENV